jgi:UDP-GlcNAc:undecaprenyl-phosphate/decaprenyl-phosphate GlcNAc-1-phosphate transferase
MITFLVAFLLSLIVAAIGTLGVRKGAIALGWLDQAKSSRKIHGKPTPRLGGVAIVAGFFAPLVGLMLVDSGVGDLFFYFEDLVWALFAGGLAIAALGLYDDLHGANARVKFVVQFAVAGVLVWAGFRIDVIANPFGQELSLGVFSVPLTLFWIVGIVNAMNLIDGLDGLAGGVAFFAVATNFVLAFVRGDVLLCLAMAALGGALLGFLLFNFNPASIFMGDTGSMFLGFALAVVSLKTSTKSGTTVALLVPIIALGLPIMDTFLAIARRAATGRPLFRADKEHIHHRLMSRLSLSHRGAVLLLYALCCLFALLALALNFANSAQSAMLLVAIGAVVFVLMRKLGYLDLAGAATVGRTRRRNTALRSVVKQAVSGMAGAPSVPALWAEVRKLAEALDAARLEFTANVADPGGTIDRLCFEVERPSEALAEVGVRLELGAEREPLGSLQVVWRDGREEVNRDEELALELIADAITAALVRIVALGSPSHSKVVALRR